MVVAMETVFTVSFAPNTTVLVLARAVKSVAAAGVLPAVQPWLAMQVLTAPAVGTSVETVKVRWAALTLPGALLSVRVTMMFSPS